MAVTFFSDRLINRGALSISPKAAFLGIGLPIVLWMLWSAFWFPLFTYAPHEDVWEHIAAISEWKANLAAPGNPQLAAEQGSPRYMPFFFALTVLAIALDLTALQVLQIAAVLNTVLLLSGIYLFFGACFRNPWAPVVGLLVMLGFWGLGWRTSNEYELRSLFYVASYPSMFAFAISLLSFWVAIKVLRGEAPRLLCYITLVLAFAIMVPTHALTAAFCLAGIGCLCLAERSGRMPRRSVVLVAALAGVLLSELWPYFSTFQFIVDPPGGVDTWVTTTNERQQATPESGSLSGFERAREIVSEHGFYNPLSLVPSLGPALLGLVALVYLALRRRHIFILLGFGAMMVPYLVFPFVPVPLAFRFLLYAVFFLHLAIVAFLLEGLPGIVGIGPNGRSFSRSRLLGWAGVLVVGGLFLGHVLFAAGHFAYTYLAKEPVSTVMARIAPHIEEDSIVLGPIRLTWPLPAFKGKIVALLHGNPLVADQHVRFDAARRFFEEPMPYAERQAILERYNVTHVLVELETAPSGLMAFMVSHGTMKGIVEGFAPKLGAMAFSKATSISRPGHRIAIFEIDG